jgi:catechol 2,3-dioxygenase-like lactoylglutathione lyase family enzyme
MSFQVKHIDHVEIQVPDRYEAARWYDAVFGLKILKDFEFWAEPSGGGPLMVSSDGGTTKLAIFEGEPTGHRPPVGFERVAFNVDGDGFMDFLSRLDELELYNHQGERIASEHAVDHALSWSIYFSDPYGNRFEITTYDYDLVKGQIDA